MQTYELWIEEFEKEPITKQRVEDEIDEVRDTISNERLWEKGSDYPNLHTDNIEQLENYLDYLYGICNLKIIKEEYDASRLGN